MPEPGLPNVGEVGSMLRSWALIGTAFVGVVMVPGIVHGPSGSSEASESPPDERPGAVGTPAPAASSGGAQTAAATTAAATAAAYIEPEAPTPFLRGLLPDAPPEPPVGGPRPRDVRDQVHRAQRAGFDRIGFLIASVPDPIDSAFAEDFDAYVASIRLALEASGYVSDQFFDPWAADSQAVTEGKSDGKSSAESTAPTDRHRREPGILLFRRRTTPAASKPSLLELFAVLLVGESPTWGVQKTALARALDTIDATCGPRVTHERPEVRRFCGMEEGARTTIRLLGPTSSGAADSIRTTIAHWLVGKMSPQPLAFPPTWNFELRSGSATARATQTILQDELRAEVKRQTGWTVPVRFRATVNPDDRLWTFVSEYLVANLGAHLNEIAVLTESNTGYGQEFKAKAKRQPPVAPPPAPGAAALDAPAAAAAADPSAPEAARSGEVVMTLSFPLNVAQVREQRERSDDETRSRPAISVPHRLLSLGGKTVRQRTDTIAVHSLLTSNANDLALKDLLRTISSEPIRYVGILATDVLDAIFLAEQVHDEFPQVVIVFFTSNLLFLHESSSFLNGALVASTYPLGSWTKRMSYPFAGDERRLLFSNEYAQGTYNAALFLTGDHTLDGVCDPRDFVDYGAPFANPASGKPDSLIAPPLWLSVVEDGQFWPLLAAPVAGDRNGYVGSIQSRVPSSKDSAFELVERDRKRAWAPPDFGRFERWCALLALMSLGVAGAYWSTRKTNGGWPVASRLLRHLVAPAWGFPHPGMHRFALFAAFGVVGLVQVMAAIPLLVETFLAAVTGARMFWRIALALLVTAAMIATGANILRTFADWIGLGIRALSLSVRRRQGRFAQPLATAARLAYRARGVGRPYLLVAALGLVLAVGLAVRWLQDNRLGMFNPTPAGLELMLLALRTRAVTGASLLGAVGLLGVAFLVWIFAHLRQVRLHQNASPLREWGVLPPYGRARELFRELGLAEPIDELLARVEGVWPSPRTTLIMIALDLFACVVARKLVIFDHLWLGIEQALPYLFVGLLGLLAWGCARAWGSWRELRKLLAVAAILPMGNAFEQLPRRLLEVFRRPMTNETEKVWRGYCVHLEQQLALKLPCERLSTAELFRIVSSLEGDRLRETWGASVVRRTAPAPDQLLDLWAEFIGLRMIAFVGYVRAHIYNGVGTVTAATLSLLWVTTMYPFQSSRVLLALALVLVLMSVGVTVVVLTQMNRNEILSRIEGTDPGKVTWDFSFVTGLFIHGALPIAALISVKFPALGRSISDWMFAVVKGVGAG